MTPPLEAGGLRVTDKRPHDWLRDGSHTAIPGSVDIRMGGVAARDTAKLGLIPVGFFSAPATGAGTRGVGGVYKSKDYAISSAAVLVLLFTQLLPYPPPYLSTYLEGG